MPKAGFAGELERACQKQSKEADDNQRTLAKWKVHLSPSRSAWR